MSNVIEMNTLESALGTTFDSTLSFEANRTAYAPTYNALAAADRVEFMQNLTGQTFATGVEADAAFNALEEKPASFEDLTSFEGENNPNAFSVKYGVGVDEVTIQYIPVGANRANEPVDTPTEVIISSMRKTAYTTGGKDGKGEFVQGTFNGKATVDRLYQKEANHVVKISGRTGDDLEINLDSNTRFMATIQGRALFGESHDIENTQALNMPKNLVDKNGVFIGTDFICTMITRTIKEGNTYVNTSDVVVNAFKASDLYDEKYMAKGASGKEGVRCLYRKEARCKFISWGTELKGLLGELFITKIKGASNMALETKRKTEQVKEVEVFNLNWKKENPALALEIEAEQNATYNRLCKTLPEAITYRRAYES